MDVIKIYDNNKGIIEMEVVLTYQYNQQNYVIYKDNESCFYIAKYNQENEKLDTNLTNTEIKYGEKILREVLTHVNC